VWRSGGACNSPADACRGLTACIEELRGSIDSIWNMTVAYPHGHVENESSFLAGHLPPVRLLLPQAESCPL
jgi:hypothetical protein